MRTDLAAARTAAATLTAENARLRDAPVRALLASTPIPGADTATVGTAEEATPGATAPAVRTHVTTGGDTLTGISKKYYGTAARWHEIYNANRAVLPNENLLPQGVELVIP
jgi:nucleoid-associated protein YgaU